MHPPTNTSLPAGARLGLGLGALGVVFGDIGTSPLYTMKECVARLPDMAWRDGVLGILSLITWSILLVVCVKYLWFITRADKCGEGGIFSLLALIHTGHTENKRPTRLTATTFLLLVGAALLYGDGVITPAISVLGAAEGFAAISPRFTPPIIAGLACSILIGLFYFQHKGTKRIGGIFGPVMLLWFVVLAVLGGWHLLDEPHVFLALNPVHGLHLLLEHPGSAATLLGGVVLAITGVEALYADMGHFGRPAITQAWYAVPFGALLLNYYGQGAYLLSHPAATENPFFAMAPAGIARTMLTGLAILAAIIASQALISGAYSLTRQAIQLGYFPRLKIIHTNADQSGQIYVPLVNTLLAIGSILTVFGFGSTEQLATAYGIAVTGTMVITTIAFLIVTHRTWHWAPWVTMLLGAGFLAIDLPFFLANVRKIADGGWLPLVIAAAVLAIMVTWKAGRSAVFARIYHQSLSDPELLEVVRSKRVLRINGSAVFMVSSPNVAPIALLHHVKSNRALQRTVVLLSVLTEETPSVPDAERLTLTELGEGLWRAVGRYGFMQSPDVNELVAQIQARGVPLKPAATTYYFNREMIVTGGDARMWEWQKRFYAVLVRNARPANDYYQIPPTQIIEMGLPVHI